MEFLENIDQQLFLFLNSLNHPVLDTVMFWISHKYFWIPLYVYLLWPLWKVYGKRIYLPLLSVIILITLSDQLSVHLFKDVFQRYRPCHNESIAHLVHLVNNKCGGQFGFVSSHASNTFGLATFLFLAIRNRFPLAYLLLIWAVIVSYSRIYLGVHYPADIIGGAFLGVLLAIIMKGLLNLMMKAKNNG